MINVVLGEVGYVHVLDALVEQHSGIVLLLLVVILLVLVLFSWRVLLEQATKVVLVFHPELIDRALIGADAMLELGAVHLDPRQLIALLLVARIYHLVEHLVQLLLLLLLLPLIVVVHCRLQREKTTNNHEKETDKQIKKEKRKKLGFRFFFCSLSLSLDTKQNGQVAAALPDPMLDCPQTHLRIG